MKTPILSIAIFNMLNHAKKQLSPVAQKQISLFLQSQITEGAFINRDGKADIYYTFFGLLLATIFNIKMDINAFEKKIKLIDVNSLNWVHFTAYVRAYTLIEYLKKNYWIRKFYFHPKVGGESNIQIRYQQLLNSNDSNCFPNLDKNSPYSQFLGRLSAETLLYPIPPLRPFSNHMTATHLSAEIVLNPSNTLVEKLLEFELSSGGFKADIQTQHADIISTATAFFALRTYASQIKFNNSEKFIFSHWRTCGGFAAHPLDECADVEYTFYALLAIGAS